MRVLKEIWNTDGKYAREDGILRCWRKVDILLLVWQADIENSVGSESVPSQDKSLSQNDCSMICDLMMAMRVRARLNRVPGSDHALVESFVEDVEDYTEEEMISMANTWVNVEDDPVIIDAQVEDELRLCDDVINIESVECDEIGDSTSELQVEEQEVICERQPLPRWGTAYDLIN